MLTDWLIEIAEANGYIVQSTSVPGRRAAHRRDDLLPGVLSARASAERARPRAGHGAHAGRRGRGLRRRLRAGRGGARHPARTGERGAHDAHRLDASLLRDRREERDGAGRGGRRCNCSNWCASRASASSCSTWRPPPSATTASSARCCWERICGAGVLPFPQAGLCGGDHPQSGLAVKTNLAAFEDAYQQASAGERRSAPRQPRRRCRSCRRRRARRALQSLLERMRALPLQRAAAGVGGRAPHARLPGSAPTRTLYLERVEGIARLNPGRRPAGPRR